MTCGLCPARAMHGLHRDYGMLSLCGACLEKTLVSARDAHVEGKKMAHEITQHVHSEIEQETQQAVGALREVKDLVIATPEDIAFAESEALSAKAQWKRIDERRKEITGPMNEALRSANDLFRPSLSAYAELEGLLRQKAEGARREIKRVNEAAMLAAQAALAANNVRQAAIAAAPITAPPATKGMTYHDAWAYRIVDAAILPREFLIPNEKAIKAWVEANGDKNVIPGVAVEKVERSIARPGSR